MQTLSSFQIQQVSGGKYNITVFAEVPDEIHPWVADIVQRINSGAIQDVYVFRNELLTAMTENIHYSEIKVQNILIDNINS